MYTILQVTLVFTVLFGGLYIRKWYAKGGRVVPHRGALVPENFWKTCPPAAEGSADRPLVVWIADTWMPTNTYPYELSRFLVRAAGWSVVILLPETAAATYDDMPLIAFHQRALVELAVRKAHCILTVGRKVFTVAKDTATNARKRLYRVIDGPTDEPADPYTPEFTPAAWLRPTALVVHPPFYPRQYHTHTDRTCITLIGCGPHQGPKEFYALARQFPTYSFMAVEGLGEQLAPPKLLNLRAVKAPGDLRGVYSQTGILVILGTSENFPRRALEAAASGIPTVGISSAGLQEVLGDAGIFCEGVPEIAETIRELREDPVAYKAASKAATKRAAAAYNSTEELEAFRNYILDLQ
jgi:hypothetical protein